MKKAILSPRYGAQEIPELETLEQAEEAASRILSGRVTSGSQKNCGSSFLPSSWLHSWIVSTSATAPEKTRKRERAGIPALSFC